MYRTILHHVPYRTTSCTVPYYIMYRTVLHHVPYHTTSCTVPYYIMWKGWDQIALMFTCTSSCSVVLLTCTHVMQLILSISLISPAIYMCMHYRDCEYIYQSSYISTCICAHLHSVREKHGGMEEWESDLVSAEYLVFYTEKWFPSQLLACIANNPNHYHSMF